MGIKITDMTEATSLLDSDKFAVSSNDAPRKATAATVTGHVIGKVEAIAAGSSVGTGDGVYLLQGGDLKPVDVDLVTQRAINIIWDKANEVSPSSGKLALKDGATEKTVTLANLASFVQSAIEAGVLDISSLSDSVALTTTDNLLVTQGSGARKTTLSAINSAIYTGLAAHVAALSALTEANNADELYVLRSGDGRKLTLEKLKEYIGGAFKQEELTKDTVGGNTYTLQELPILNTVMLFINGVYHSPNKYTISDSVLTIEDIPDEASAAVCYRY